MWQHWAIGAGPLQARRSPLTEPCADCELHGTKQRSPVGHQRRRWFALPRRLSARRRSVRSKHQVIRSPDRQGCRRVSRTSANTDKLSLLHCDYHRPPVGISTASAASANGKEITTRISTKNHEDPKVRRQFNFIGHHSKCSIYSHLSRFSTNPGWNVGTQKIKF